MFTGMNVNHHSNKFSPYTLFEYIFIIGMACVPLFSNFPYRVNIFLSWEGAFRMSQGQLPFKDFGTPLGGIYWVIPAIFFKILGPQMITLVKAQVFLNIISGLSFRSILKSLFVSPAIRALSVVVFVISYSFFNFWPWYNHTVIVYQLLSFAFLFQAFNCEGSRKRNLKLILAAITTMMAFYTKQDAGAMGLLISLTLLFYLGVSQKKWQGLLIYTLSTFLFLLIYAGFFSRYGISYWFNLGQDPHSARVSGFDLAESFFGFSQWIKFYLFIILLLLLSFSKSIKHFFSGTSDILFFILTLGILVEAAIFQVTSYTPPDNNIFFHSFAFAFIMHRLHISGIISLNNKWFFCVCLLGILIWWSGNYWKYLQRVVSRTFIEKKPNSYENGENVVNRKTYIIKQTPELGIPLNKWVLSDLSTLKGIYLPVPTIEGITRLRKMPLFQNKSNLKVLNMSELTSLAAEIPFELEKGSHYPLWYHLGVGMFNKQAAFFEQRVRDQYYDIILFENIPALNNFYPFRVRDSLKLHYNMVDSFMAPRRGETSGFIEVYSRVK
jgi:hypothetical protein